LFIRAKKKPGEKPKATTAAPAEETPEYLFSNTYSVDTDQSFRYAEASLDRNPIHVDPKMGQAAGHPGVILHGLCTMAMSTRELVDNLADGNSARVARIQVRFTKIVLPNDTLTTRAWLVDQDENGRTIGFETLNQDGKPVIGNAIAEIRNP
ncbi:MAG: MaoC/PaaZ C-terminal domain-containing protein, partial [Myxococcota bacterium]|nr:MaoC/PaaZ C-terminal domain-containing protein [Myxococcota bacterium]